MGQKPKTQTLPLSASKESPVCRQEHSIIKEGISPSLTVLNAKNFPDSVILPWSCLQRKKTFRSCEPVYLTDISGTISSCCHDTVLATVGTPVFLSRCVHQNHGGSSPSLLLLSWFSSFLTSSTINPELVTENDFIKRKATICVIRVLLLTSLMSYPRLSFLFNSW